MYLCVAWLCKCIVIILFVYFLLVVQVTSSQFIRLSRLQRSVLLPLGVNTQTDILLITNKLQMRQFEKQHQERRNHFHLVGLQANLNDRVESYLKFTKKIDNTPPSKQPIQPLSRSLLRKKQPALQEYFPSFQKREANEYITVVKSPKTEEGSESKEFKDLKKIGIKYPTDQSVGRGRSDNSRLKPQQPEQQSSRGDDERVYDLLKHNFVTILSLISKKDSFFDRMNKETFIPYYDYQLSQTKDQQRIVSENITKLMRFLQNKSRYKYRTKVQVQSLIQLQIIHYNAKKREKFGIQNRSAKIYDNIIEEEYSPIQKRKKTQPQGAMDFASWKKQNEIEVNSKVFIVKGGYSDVRDNLLDRGWFENPDVYSPFFDLKWTCKVQDIDFDRINDNQFVNHFDQNQTLTSKYGLCKNIRSLCWSEHVNFNSFYPRCYDLGDTSDFQDFIEDFKITKVKINPQIYSATGAEMTSFRRLRVGLSIHILQRLRVPFNKLMASMLIKDDCPLIQKGEWMILRRESEKVKGFESQLRQKDMDLQSMISSHLEKVGLISQDDDFYRQLAQELVLVQESSETNAQVYSQISLNGARNIWIVKPDFSSRGRGIHCFDELEPILDHVMFREGTFVIQKYIEHPLVIKQRKFDIRQWVLVQDLHPPKIWFFKECYVRFSAEQLDLDNLKNKFSHLTNNSIAKHSNQFYKSEIKGNMWSQEQFSNFFKENNNGKDIFFESIQPKFKDIIIYTIKCCQDLMRCKKRSFEIFGYDFMIDSAYNVWLIEINSSPAMDHSTQITANLVPKLLRDSVKVILDNPLAKNKRKVGNFQLIYSGDEKITQYV